MNLINNSGPTEAIKVTKALGTHWQFILGSCVGHTSGILQIYGEGKREKPKRKEVEK